MATGGFVDDCSAGVAEAEQRVLEVSPDPVGTWIPSVDDAYLPYVGCVFPSLEAGVEFYRRYAGMGGFDVRQSTTKKKRGVTKLSYLVCNKHGKKGDRASRLKIREKDDTGTPKQRRRTTCTRTGCNARVGFRRIDSGRYIISFLEVEHNHSLCSGQAKMFMKGNRKLDFGHQTFIDNCARANIGPAQALRLLKEVVGGYENVGATSIEFFNFKRDLQVYIDGRDGQMLIEKLRQKNEICADFFYAFHLDKNNHLARIFWADPVARSNYLYFGDVVFFDATYGTNRYDLVFVPFTGVDNHKRCITFAGGLLTKEDIDSYTWLLENFKSAMGKPPIYFVTDQDPAIQVALPRVFNGCRHRFCMWHIMTKVSEKVGNDLAKDDVFRRKLNALVWNENMRITHFEEQWQSLMVEYNLVNHRWFVGLYEIRSSWIPAFFNEIFMGGLVRTTSRSEGENSVFGKFSYPKASLLEFYTSFEGVLDAQRHNQLKRDAESEGYIPEFKTPLGLERHAAAAYTVTTFYDVQKEIVAGCFYCRVIAIREEAENTLYDIKSDNNCVFTVQHNPKDNSAVCSCGLFYRVGIVCKYMFLVYKDAQLECIPGPYIVPRWTKRPATQARSNSGQSSISLNPAELSPRTQIQVLWKQIYACVGVVGTCTKRMARMTQILQETQEELMSNSEGQEQVGGKIRAIEALWGLNPRPQSPLNPPRKPKTKVAASESRAIEKLGSKRVRSQNECVARVINGPDTTVVIVHWCDVLCLERSA